MPAPAGDSPRVRDDDAACAERVAPAAPAAAASSSAAQLGAESPARRVTPVSSDTMSTRSSSRGSSSHVRAQADGGVERLRAVVKEIERPDVDRAAGEIDSGRRGRGDAHADIIIVRASPECRRDRAAAVDDIGQLLIGSLPGTTIVAASGDRWRASSISAARSSSAATSRRPSRSPSWPATSRRWAAPCRPG